MQPLHAIKKILRIASSQRETYSNPENGYDLWAGSYDKQPNNLMLSLDEELFCHLLQNTELNNKVIIDIGCGTGRHWQKIYARNPEKLMGYDVSDGMLSVLRHKFPHAITKKISNNILFGLNDLSCDIIISTLTVAHIDNMEEAFAEWNRVLKNGGEIIITDYHPSAFSKGANRTFRQDRKLISIRNNIYPIDEIIGIAGKYGYSPLQFLEKKIDESVKHYYEKQNAWQLFQQYFGTPIIYGLHLKKQDATS